MPRARLSMRKIKEILRLKWHHHLSDRKVAHQCGISRPTVKEYLRRAQAAGLSWPLPDELDDHQLEIRLYPSAPSPSDRDKPKPHWSHIHRELKHKSVTLYLLWVEYRQQYPNGYQYSWFCEHYRQWLGRCDLSMRQTHRAGEKCFVDYAGQTVDIIDSQTGEIKSAQIFIAVLGASNYTYCEATLSQTLPDWLMAHARAFDYFGGVPELIVPDNLKSAVTKPHRYEPDLNPSYQDLAEHFNTTVLPARVRKPRDKAKVENGVLLVERWILAVLRHQQFFSLSELNGAIARCLETLNQKHFKKLPGSRLSMFKDIDQPALNPLPENRYVFAEFKKVRVHLDYHVEIDGHYYSVPHQLVKKQLDTRITEHTIECFLKGKRIASHVRSYFKGRHTTVIEHMPAQHQHYAQYSTDMFINWASSVGPATAQVVKLIIKARRHPQQAYRSCLGLMRLGKSYSPDRLENACLHAISMNSLSYKSIESILKHRIDQQSVHPFAPSPLPHHDNVRGKDYYH